VVRDNEEGDIIGFCFNRHKVPYKVLNEGFGDEFMGGVVDMFIDMRYVMNIMSIEFWQDGVRRELIKKPNEVLAGLFSLLVHYRRYFTEKRDCRVRFYVLFDDGKGDPYRQGIVSAHGLKRLEKTVAPHFLGFLYKKAQVFNDLIPDFVALNSEMCDLTVLPSLVGPAKNRKTIILSNDPEFHEYSGTEFGRQFCCLHPAGVDTKFVGRNGFFGYLYKKFKWATKNPDDISTHDSYAGLFMAATTWGDDLEGTDPVFKNKKAVDLINKLKLSEPVFDWSKTDIEPYFGDASVPIYDRREVYSPHLRSFHLEETFRMHVESELEKMEWQDRRQFSALNAEYFNNDVEDSVLFAT
jgi:hypothetical protein